MCGISGFFSCEKPVSGARFYNAHCLIADRGPDDEGFMAEKDGKLVPLKGQRTVARYEGYTDIRCCEKLRAVLGHTRLSIIDLSDNAHQPMYDDKSGIALSYNGEIYNYKELRSSLEQMGYTFRTESDTEVVLNAYIAWGESCFSKFNGMWAIAIYDRHAGDFLLCRDRFGIKPLFYIYDAYSLLFASEMKVICCLKKKLDVNEDIIDRYLKTDRISDDEETIIKGIMEVKPGECVRFSHDMHLRRYRYWNYTPSDIKWTREEADEEFRYIFRNAVALRMRSDVEVGSLLSGGLDSNTIVGTIAGEGLLNKNYNTYSSVYEEEQYSEKKYIDLAVDKYGLNSHLIYITPDLVMDYLDKELYRTEMPIRSVAPVLEYILYKNIRETSNVKVVINGQGADELFGGYNGDYMTRFLHLINKGRLGDLQSEVREYRSNRGDGIKQIAAGILSKSKIPHRRNYAFNDITFYQVTHTPLREYLMYDDRASMAFGIETRTPFLDYRLVEFAYSLDCDYKINKDANKAIVRRYAKELVPLEILNRKDKMGFTSPQELWQRKEWRSVMDDAYENIRKNGLFHLDVQSLYSSYMDYRENKSNNWGRIWNVFCLYRWKKVFGY